MLYHHWWPTHTYKLLYSVIIDDNNKPYSALLCCIIHDDFMYKLLYSAIIDDLSKPYLYRTFMMYHPWWTSCTNCCTVSSLMTITSPIPHFYDVSSIMSFMYELLYSIIIDDINKPYTAQLCCIIHDDLHIQTVVQYHHWWP